MNSSNRTQQAAIVASAQDWAKTQAVGKPKAADKKCNVAPLETAADRTEVQALRDRIAELEAEREKLSRQMAGDPDLFTLGKALLTAQGVSVKDAGSLLGRLRRDHGDAAVLQALQFAQETKPSELRAWLVKTVPAMASGTSKRNGVRIGHQDYAAGWGGAADGDF